ncbi:hypothetical protein [Shewanella sp. UCD-KL21]|uniref:hypothetical protein n=1 Tax=Shewanella sp. UCD-KL21 TaxID=1917164 RepID=UPI0009709F7B|nr:hypothetical protein [Shewanella sp. UCD-KL21]
MSNYSNKLKELMATGLDYNTASAQAQQAVGTPRMVNNPKDAYGRSLNTRVSHAPNQGAPVIVDKSGTSSSQLGSTPTYSGGFQSNKITAHERSQVQGHATMDRASKNRIQHKAKTQAEFQQNLPNGVLKL